MDLKNLIKKVIRPIRTILTYLVVEPSVLYPHISKRVWHDTNAFHWAAAYIVKNQIRGDYVEFGVYKGTSFIEMFNQVTDYSRTFFSHGAKSTGIPNYFENMRFHAFDSFEGLPDTDNSENPIQYFRGAYKSTEGIFKDRLRAAKVDMSRVTITSGWFNHSLTTHTAAKLKLDQIAVAYVDCDVYESALDVLNFITPHLKTGAVLICDDWFRNRGLASAGVQGAVIEWLKRNPRISLQHFHSSDTRTAVFIVRLDSEYELKQIDSV
jgi:O-methyltransferase